MQQGLDHRVVFCVAALLLASGSMATAQTAPLPRARPEGVQGEPAQPPKQPAPVIVSRSWQILPSLSHCRQSRGRANALPPVWSDCQMVLAGRCSRQPEPQVNHL
jgi:hypothetical protein